MENITEFVINNWSVYLRRNFFDSEQLEDIVEIKKGIRHFNLHVVTEQDI